jgi:hypothetical protein
VLATSDSGGKVSTAIYARPHVLEDSTVAFIMRNRLSRKEKCFKLVSGEEIQLE